MRNAITPLQKLRLGQQWENARLAYFRSKGDEEKVIELTSKINAIEKKLENAYWEN